MRGHPFRGDPRPFPRAMFFWDRNFAPRRSEILVCMGQLGVEDRSASGASDEIVHKG